MKLFARIMKVNEAERTVEGIIADETVDLSGEVFDYAKSKPHFVAWSESIAKATGGKSLGNVRVMHGSAVAGVTKEIHFNDDAKEIAVKAHIVDDNEWNKTLAGCYTGFSIGGKYGDKWDDPVVGKKRYAAIPSEYSIVDVPCNPNAMFTVVKADGSEELHKYATPSVDACVRKVLGTSADAVQKGMYTVSRLAELLGSLNYVRLDSTYEANNEGDGSTIPAELMAQVRQLGSILVRMTQEEVAELTADDARLARYVESEVMKYQPKSQEDAMTDELKKKHDEAVAALATATTDLAKRDEALAKANDELAKAAAKVEELTKALDTAATQLAEKDDLMTKAAARIAEQGEILAKFSAAPAPVRAALVAVAKSADAVVSAETVEQVLEADGTVNKAATAIKHALMNPVVQR